MAFEQARLARPTLTFSTGGGNLYTSCGSGVKKSLSSPHRPGFSRPGNRPCKGVGRT